jgi:hypothetical protein
MKKLRIILLTTSTLVGAALICYERAPLISEANAQFVQFGGDRVIPLGFCTYAPSSATTNVTNGTGCFGTAGGGVPLLAKYAYICVNSPGAFWRDDGIAATASGSGGQPLGGVAPNCIYYPGNLSAFSIISSSGTVGVTLYAQP